VKLPTAISASKCCVKYPFNFLERQSCTDWRYSLGVSNSTLSTSANPTPSPHLAAANAAAASFAGLTERLTYLPTLDTEQIKKAYRFADEAHLGQLRKNGEPYITHPIAVAVQCTHWKLDANAIMAALLHDAMEDCGVTKIELAEKFGATVADLVDGLTKLEKLQFNTREENQAESFRKMLLAMSKDIRVILIKLADRTHNMRTLGDVPRANWRRIAIETLDIYAPIAHRLGLNQTYQELQDLCMQHLLPWRYAVLTKAVAKARTRRGDLIEKVTHDLQAAIASTGLNAKVAGREKSLYSVYKKMDQKHLSFSQVTDIYGFRIVVPNPIDCYTVLGVLHQLYKPVPGKFKDYIAIPKANGYQSLHTTLVGPASINIEFQMRTPDMDIVAEDGIAAHWLYKRNEAADEPDQKLGTKWLQSLLDIQNETHDTSEFWDHVKVDLFPDAVYVFTPQGKILALPRGATALDFAYAIHSTIGQHASSVKINGRAAPLKAELANGDSVEVITLPTANPTPAWLSFVRTARARSKIRSHLKQMATSEAASMGERMLTQSLRAEGFAQLPDTDAGAHLIWDKLLRFTGNRTREELMSDIGLGKRIANIVAKRLVNLLQERGDKSDALLITHERFNSDDKLIQGAIVLDGSESASVQFASCCRPLPGDIIVGYLGRGEGLMVHRNNCTTAEKLYQKDRERFVEVDWADEPVRLFETALTVTVKNDKGVLAKVAAALASAEVDISHIDMGSELAQDTTDLKFIVAVRDRAHLEQAIQKLRRTANVVDTHGLRGS
jgi:GTP diphosphokinase / guanosine-3',5'-bis(diphosphate) 3'-diphosphatase